MQPGMGMLEGEERAKLKGKLLHNAAKYSNLGYEIGEHELSLARFEVRRPHPFNEDSKLNFFWLDCRRTLVRARPLPRALPRGTSTRRRRTSPFQRRHLLRRPSLLRPTRPAGKAIWLSIDQLCLSLASATISWVPAPPPSAQPLTTYSTGRPGYQSTSSASPSASATSSWAPANPGKASKVRRGRQQDQVISVGWQKRGDASCPRCVAHWKVKRRTALTRSGPHLTTISMQSRRPSKPAFQDSLTAPSTPTLGRRRSRQTSTPERVRSSTMRSSDPRVKSTVSL